MECRKRRIGLVECLCPECWEQNVLREDGELETLLEAPRSSIRTRAVQRFGNDAQKAQSISRQKSTMEPS
jgi:hypothetical protein